MRYNNGTRILGSALNIGSMSLNQSYYMPVHRHAISHNLFDYESLEQLDTAFYSRVAITQPKMRIGGLYYNNLASFFVHLNSIAIMT